jgi:hypothetical protein
MREDVPLAQEGAVDIKTNGGIVSTDVAEMMNMLFVQRQEYGCGSHLRVSMCFHKRTFRFSRFFRGLLTSPSFLLDSIPLRLVT